MRHKDGSRKLMLNESVLLAVANSFYTNLKFSVLLFFNSVNVSSLSSMASTQNFKDVVMTSLH